MAAAVPWFLEKGPPEFADFRFLVYVSMGGMLRRHYA